MELQVWYSVPVAAHVNTETGKVERVVVIDEEITLGNPDTTPGKGWDVTLIDYSGPAPTGVDAALAVRIAEHEAWPVWENGY
jgi:hypothetical protein